MSHLGAFIKKINVVLNGEQEKNPLLVCGGMPNGDPWDRSAYPTNPHAHYR